MTEVRALIDREATLANAITLATSFVIAETLYKFHSFTLETLAFLATWYTLRVLATLLSRRTTR
jgi:hypothetical protein